MRMESRWIALMVLGWTELAFAGPKALVYNGEGACKDDCAKSAFDSARAAGFDPVYVGDREESPAIFNDAKVWIHPGGYAGTGMNAMSPVLKRNLKNFIWNGGGYVGYCAGAFVATSTVGTTRIRGLGIIPGNTKLYGKGIRIFKSNWQGSERYIYWEGGPYFRNMPETVEHLAFYPNGASASVRTRYGKGRVWVTGLHPESPQWWKDESGYQDIDGDDWDLVNRMLAWVTEAH
jgi:glutamine amidotransferase-like uncharacterized protein